MGNSDQSKLSDLQHRSVIAIVTLFVLSPIARADECSGIPADTCVNGRTADDYVTAPGYSCVPATDGPPIIVTSFASTKTIYKAWQEVNSNGGCNGLPWTLTSSTQRTITHTVNVQVSGSYSQTFAAKVAGAIGPIVKAEANSQATWSIQAGSSYTYSGQKVETLTVSSSPTISPCDYAYFNQWYWVGSAEIKQPLKAVWSANAACVNNGQSVFPIGGSRQLPTPGTGDGAGRLPYDGQCMPPGSCGYVAFHQPCCFPIGSVCYQGTCQDPCNPTPCTETPDNCHPQQTTP